MKIKTFFCDNYFPPTIIECYKFIGEIYENRTQYRYPNDGNYGRNVFGVWKVNYKKIDTHYYCEGQLNVHKQTNA